MIKNKEPHKCTVMGIVLKNAQYKDHGIGTQAERLAVQYVLDDLNIPTLFADAVRTNVRSQHILEKAGFRLIRQDRDYLYYRIGRKQNIAAGWV